MARQLIAAIQNTLLAGLFVRLLLPVLLLFQYVALDNPNPRFLRGLLAAYACVVLVAFLAWAVGFVAIRTRPQGRLSFERIQDAPSNGFEAWARPPADGLKPPRLMMAIVMALGKAGSRKSAWQGRLLSTFCFVATAFLFLRHFDEAILASIGPSLASPGLRIGVFWALAAVMFAAILRSWAIDSRKRLESRFEPTPR